jgi:hypothetical protein
MIRPDYFISFTKELKSQFSILYTFTVFIISYLWWTVLCIVWIICETQGDVFYLGNCESVVHLFLVLWRSVAGLSPRRPGSFPGPVFERFVVHKVALVQVYLRMLRCASVNVIIRKMHTSLHPNITLIRRTSGQS